MEPTSYDLAEYEISYLTIKQDTTGSIVALKRSNGNTVHLRALKYDGVTETREKFSRASSR